MPVVITIEAHFVGIDDRIVIFRGNVLHRAFVTLSLPLGDIVTNHLVLQAVLERGRSGDAGTQFQHIPVVTC